MTRTTDLTPSALRRVAVLTASTRPGRICPAIASWLLASLRDATPAAVTYDGLDLADVGLPFLDEPGVPAHGGPYIHPHTRAWSETVRSFDGFVFVFPQYNWGYPAVLKNALDFLYSEWAAKPAATVTYGNRGGGRAAAQLVQVLTGLHMRPLPTGIQIAIGPDDVDAHGQLRDPASTFQEYQDAAADLAQALAESFRDDKGSADAQPPAS